MGEVFAAAEDPTLSEKDRAELVKIITDATADLQKHLDAFSAEHEANMAELNAKMHQFDTTLAEVTDFLDEAKKDRKTPPE
jgi:hypothetical protein